MKKGFTILELLAVIIVIAIIAIIAIPQLLNVVSTAKDSSKTEAAKNYVKALEDQIIADQFDKAALKNGCYVVENGVIERRPGDEIKPSTKGDLPTEGWVTIRDDNVTEGQLAFDNTIVHYDGKNASVDSDDSITLPDACIKD